MSQSALSMPTNVANGGGRPKRGPKRDYNKLLSEREGEMGPWTEAHWEPEKGMRAAEQFPADAPEESAAVRADATVRPSARKQHFAQHGAATGPGTAHHRSSPFGQQSTSTSLWDRGR